MNFSQPDWRCQWFHRHIGTEGPAWTISSSSTDTGHYKNTGQIMVHCFKASGGSSSMKESKTVTMPAPRGEKVNPAAHCIMGSVAKENTRQCSCEGNSTFTQRERTGGKICPVAWVGPCSWAWCQQLPQQRCRGTGPRGPAVKGLWPHSCGAWNSEAEDIQHRLTEQRNTYWVWNRKRESHIRWQAQRKLCGSSPQ